MLMFIVMMIMFFIVASLILTLNILMSMKLLKNREKMSPFECGFDPISKSRMPFSVQFFMISLIFLIFDIEITLLIPLAYLLHLFNNLYIIISTMFLMILIIGLIIEYMEKSLDWKI